MILLFLGLFIVGLSGYVVFTNLWIRYIFAHVGGLGILGLFSCWAASLAFKKGYSYLNALFLGFVLPIGLGVISVGVVYSSGGHGCGGIVSLFFSIIVILFYSLAKKRAVIT
jgi:hypothetical protein